jgi:hypothetical protein
LKGSAVDKKRIKELNRKGFIVGDVKEFLNLSDEEMEIVDLIAVFGFLLLFWWSIFPFLGERVKYCSCGNELSRFGWCNKCRRIV